MTTTAQATSAAVRLARLEAAGRHRGPSACPYPQAATGTARAARGAWLREYRRLRPQDFPAVDYGDAVTAAAFGDGPPAGTDSPATVQPDLLALPGGES
jgi:hypothetical protein